MRGKIENYIQKTNDGKILLRNALRKYVPIDYTQGAKQGFSAPDASWFKDKSSGFVDAKLLNEDAAMYQWLDRAAVKEMVGEHLNGTRNRRLLIWSLLNLEELGTSVFQ